MKHLTNKKRILSIVSLSLILVFLFAGCGGAASDSFSSASNGINTGVGSGGLGSIMPQMAATEDTYGEDFIAEEAVGVAEYDKAYDPWESFVPQDAEAKIVYSADARIETKDYETTVSQVNDLFSEYQVVITGSNLDDSAYSWDGTGGSHRNMYWYCRVPSQNLFSFLDALQDTEGHMANYSVSSSDMTEVYNDNEIRLEALRVQEEKLMNMLEQAETISDMLEVERRLNEVETDIKLLTDNNADIDYDVQFSEVMITVSEVTIYSEPEAEPWHVRFKESFGKSFTGFTVFIGEFAIGVVYMLPYLIVAAIIVLIVIVCGKRSKAKRAQRRMATIDVPPQAYNSTHAETKESTDE